MNLRTGDRLADQEPLQLQPWRARHLLLKDHEKRVFSRPLFVFTAVIQANLLARGEDSRGGCRVAAEVTGDPVPVAAAVTGGLTDPTQKKKKQNPKALG